MFANSGDRRAGAVTDDDDARIAWSGRRRASELPGLRPSGDKIFRLQKAAYPTQLGLGRSTLSQNVRALEERLGVRLLNRTTRSVSLTEAGAHLLARVLPSLSELKAAADELANYRLNPTGLLRLVVQPPVGTFLIEPILARFMREYPGIQLDVAVVKMPTDIVKEGFDAGIRFGEQIDHDMVTMRVVGEARFLVVASPDYLKNRPRPKTPRDLRRHDCIRNRLPNGAIFGWDFEKNGRTLRASVEGRLIVNDIELSLRAVRDGLGLAYLLHDYIAADLKAGRLVPLLQEWSPRLSGFFLYHPSRRQMSGPLQALISFLKAEAARRGVSPATPPSTGVYPSHRLVGKSRR